MKLTMKSELLVLSADDVQRLVRTALKPEKVVQCMARVFEMSSSTEIEEPYLSTLSPEHTTFYMPCRLPAPVNESSLVYSAVKVASVSRTGGGNGVPGTTLVLDETTGAARAILNSRTLTALRNAAGSVLATQLLGPKKPTHITFFGAGLQIKQHASLFIQTYPSITHCTVINRSLNDRLKELLADLTLEFPGICLEGIVLGSHGVEPAVRGADIICCATSSTRPLFDSKWLKNGAHVNLIGSYTPAMREADTGLIERAGRRVVVDEIKACLVDAGELVDAVMTEKELVEIGTLVCAGATKTLEEVRQAGNVTVFKSVGLGAQDVAIAALMVELAEKNGKVGTRILYD
ncbi:ornithine cyclodeaminase/mu-crystallin family protein [Rhizoctonia solani AG-3 Rhs1AP]|uniref:Ornithine cyclodeaminase/mu-crystallin family protein n=2 Tax=Rhizoctonia solani AG-3 TaxID=1086053 RepID=A0A074SEC4_9AGAM|nr:ornithine cyclodeaminase/mu-crystallin family protein [Rhizoctonia solani AG-3 Rhs1AP]KEP48362.1 ornithine cyclodeaminase/mu-crystallin family protein [Rhizoctonia solani 123E]